MSLPHQDWTTIYLKKPKQETQVQSKQHGHSQGQTFSSTANKPAWKIEQMVDSDKGKPIIYVNKEDSLAIKSMRESLKMTQGQLATALNMKPKDVQEIESGKALENKAVIANMKKIMKRFLDNLTAK